MGLVEFILSMGATNSSSPASGNRATYDDDSFAQYDDDTYAEYDS